MTDSLAGRICPKPFTSVEFHLEGDVYVCYPKWLSTPIGNIEKNSVEEIWNSEVARDIRRSIIDGTYRYCDKQVCPYIQAGVLPKHGQLTEKVLGQVKKEQTSLANLPVEIMLNYDQSCNLTCPSCRTEKISHVPGSTPFQKSTAYTDLIYEKFIETLGENHLRLNITGSGDPFASQQYRQLLERLDGEKLPNLRIELQTNGLLLTPHTWKRLERIHKNIDVINVSIDAATEATYLKIRRGGNWEMILSNMRFLGELRRKRKIHHLQANMVVQKGNYRIVSASHY